MTDKTKSSPSTTIALARVLEEAGFRDKFTPESWARFEAKNLQLHDMPNTERFIRHTLPGIYAELTSSSIASASPSLSGIRDDFRRARQTIKRIKNDDFNGLPWKAVKRLMMGSLATGGHFATPEQDIDILQLYAETQQEIGFKLPHPPKLYVFDSDLPTAFIFPHKGEQILAISSEHLRNRAPDVIKSIIAHELNEAEELALQPRKVIAGYWAGKLGFSSLNHARELRADARSMQTAGGTESALAAIEQPHARMEEILTPIHALLGIVQGKSQAMHAPESIKRMADQKLSNVASKLHPSQQSRIDAIKKLDEEKTGWAEAHLARADARDAALKR